MAPVADKLSRLREATEIIFVHAAGWQSRRRLIECYANLGHAMTDDTIIDLQLNCGTSRRRCRMRRSDIFTLAEIFHERQYAMRSRLGPTPTVVDAGANIGLASLWLSGKHPGAKIHAFEPEPANFDLLTQNMQPLGARVNRVALAGADGEIDLKLSSHGAMHSTSSRADLPCVKVRCLRLDSYLEECGIASVDLLKLDVEGAELEVLRGLGARIADVGTIVGEVHEDLVDVDAFYNYLRSTGFSAVARREFRDGAVERVHGFEATRRPS